MSDKKNFKNRESRLKEEFQNINKGVANLHNEIIIFRTEGKDMPPSKYVFEIKIKTVSNIDDIGIPKIIEKVYFQVEIPENYPIERPIGKFLGQTKIYHPHVKVPVSKLPSFIKPSSAIWVDYFHDEKETILEFVIRVAKSLQFQPLYINKDADEIGNQKALDWFLHNFQKNPSYFPIDGTPVYKRPNLEIMDSSIKKEPDVKEKNEPINEELKPKAFNIISTPIKKKFKIQETSAPYRPKTKKKRNRIEGGSGYEADVRLGTNEHELLIEEEAGFSMFSHIDWGHKSKWNTVEQGGLLLGDVFFDSSTNAYQGVVNKIIPARNSVGTNVYLSLSHEVWKNMIDEIDELRENKGYEGQVIGWYHTHPNMLDVFMSGTDINTQRSMFPHDWQFAIVLNPHLLIWRAFRGYDVEECQGFIGGDFIKPDEGAIQFVDEFTELENNSKVLLNNIIRYLNSDKVTMFLIVLSICLGLIWVYFILNPEKTITFFN